MTTTVKLSQEDIKQLVLAQLEKKGMKPKANSMRVSINPGINDQREYEPPSVSIEVEVE